MNMFAVRCRSACTARTKNGQPAQNTTGAASTSSTQFPASHQPVRQDDARDHRRHRQHEDRHGEGRGDPEPPGHVAQLGVVLRRRPAGSSAPGAMPHFGQVPGPSWTTSGCIGQVYFAPGDRGAGGCVRDSRSARPACLGRCTSRGRP